jgi:hypothetical protein
MSKIDLVYPLGKGSVWNDNELRFSLRSVQQNMKNVGKIFIVGECPNWLKNVVHIPCVDVFKNNSDGNIITKVLEACKHEGLSDDFLFMNDDYLIMNPVDATKIPAYHKGDMATFDQEYWDKSFWRGRLLRTYKILKKMGHHTFHFDGHLPIIINKKLFPEIISQFNYHDNIGYCMKSIYANVAYKVFQQLNGEKKVLSRSYTVKDLELLFTSCTFVSVKDDGLTLNFKKWIFGKFPDVSKFEKDNQNTKQLEVLHWFNNRDTQEGIELYLKYGKSKNVKDYFLKHSVTLNLRMIEKHLHKLI